jgi:hypothetical protein
MDNIERVYPSFLINQKKPRLSSRLSREILYTKYTVLCTFAKCEHKSKCYEECCRNKYESLRSCLSLRHLRGWSDFRRSWSWCTRSWRSYYSRSRSFELISDTLVVSIRSSLCSCLDIRHARYYWKSEHTDHFTIFLISFLESISGVDICFYELHFLSRREDE